MTVSTQHFFVGPAYLGSRQIPTMRIVPGLEIRPHYSVAYFCMRCGDVWARVLHDKAPLTQCTVRPCKKHGDGRLSCHDTWHDMPTRVEPDWPEPALRYELEASIELALTGEDCASPGATI